MGITLTDVIGYLGGLVSPTDLEDPQNKETLATFLAENNCMPSKNADWPELMGKLDECKLWATVGPTFEKIGLVHPFDPRTIDALKNYGADMAKIEECAKPRVFSEYEKFELTAMQSFSLCLGGFSDGSCSEYAYKYSALSLYNNPKADLVYIKWPGHIAAYDKKDTEGMKEDLERFGRPSIKTDRPSELILAYYYSRYKKSGDPSDLKTLERLFPDHPDTLFLLGERYIEDKEYSKVIEIAGKLEGMGFRNDSIGLLKGMAWEKGEMKEAIALGRLYHYNLGSDGNFPSIFDPIRGENYFRYLAFDLIEVLKNRDIIEWYYRYKIDHAVEQVKNEEYEEAKKTALDILGLSNNPYIRSYAYNVLAEISVSNRDYLTSAIYYLSAFSETTYGSTMMTAASMYMYATGDLDMSLRLLDSGRFLEPRDPEYLVSAAAIYLDALDLEKAYKYAVLYADATKTERYDTQVIPFILLYTGKYAEAEEGFRHLLEKDPEGINCLAGLTIALAHQSKPEYKNYLKELTEVDGATDDEMFYFTLQWLAAINKDKESVLKFAGLAKGIAPGLGAATNGGEFTIPPEMIHKPTEKDKKEALEYAKKFL